jgi:hypothetical protein
MWVKALARLLIFLPLAIIVLPIPTAWATFKQLNRLPWGLDPLFGCREDGWNGTGCDPDFPRVFWRNVDGVTVQGWYPDYLGVIWSDLSFIKRWWHGYKWCAWRNVCWNLRLTDWFGTSVHFDDIRVLSHYANGKEQTVVWYSKIDSKKRYFKRREIPLLGGYWDYGYEIPFDYFDRTTPVYKRLRKEGYTFDVAPFKDRSIPSIRPRFKLND